MCDAATIRVTTSTATTSAAIVKLTTAVLRMPLAFTSVSTSTRATATQRSYPGSEVDAGDERDRRDGRRLAEQEQRARGEPGGRRELGPSVAVGAARDRMRHRELGRAQGVERRDDRRDRQAEQQPGTRRAGGRSPHEEDARAEHRRDSDRGGGRHPESTLQFGHGRHASRSPPTEGCETEAP